MQSKPFVFLVGKTVAERQPLAIHLRAKGWELTESDRGQHILDKVRRNPGHLILLYSSLGDMHWLTFLRILRSDENSFFVPVIVLLDSGFTLEQKERTLLESYQVEALLPSTSSASVFDEAFENALSGKHQKAAIERMLDEAKKRYKDGLLDSARRIYEEILKDNKANLAARAGLMYAGKEDRSEYMKQLKYVLDSDPENYNFKFELMRHYAATNELRLFKKLFDEVIAELSRSDETYWLTQLAEVCLSLKLTEFCDKIVEVMLRSDAIAQSWEPYLLKARTVLSLGSVQDAQKWVAKAETCGGADRPEVLNLRGIIRRKLGSDKDALVFFEKAASLAEHDHRLAFNMALCYRNLRQDDKAIASLKRSIALCPTYKRARELLERMQAK